MLFLGKFVPSRLQQLVIRKTHTRMVSVQCFGVTCNLRVMRMTGLTQQVAESQRGVDVELVRYRRPNLPNRASCANI